MLALLGAASAQPASDIPCALAADPAFEAAQLSVERNHWPHAYAAFAALADRDHAEAAVIALQMARHGPALYGSHFAASAGQRERWAALAAGAAGAAASSGTGCGLAPRVS